MIILCISFGLHSLNEMISQISAHYQYRSCLCLIILRFGVREDYFQKQKTYPCPKKQIIRLKQDRPNGYFQNHIVTSSSQWRTVVVNYATISSKPLLVAFEFLHILWLNMETVFCAAPSVGISKPNYAPQITAHQPRFSDLPPSIE